MLPFYKKKTVLKSIYTLSFKAKSLNDLTKNSKFKIYIGNTDIDWIIIDEEITNEFKLFKLTTTFYFENEDISIFGINNPFRIGFEKPCGNMIYEIKDIILNNNCDICNIDNIDNINNHIKIIYHEIYISKSNYSIYSSYNLENHLSNYITNKNIVLLPYDFILNNDDTLIKINNNDILLIIESVF